MRPPTTGQLMDQDGSTATPRLVLGTMTFADTVDKDGATRILSAAFDAGIRDVDTANAYAGGATEQLLGELSRAFPEDVHIATKVGMPHPDAKGDPPLSPAAVRASVEGSLRRLRRDGIDLLYLHQPDRQTPIADTLAEVALLHQEGKIARLGLSNFSSWMTRDAVLAATDVGAPEPGVSQQLLNVVARRLEDEFLEMARAHDIELIVYNPLAGGLLSGKHRWGEHPQTGRFGDSRLAEMYSERYWSESTFEAVEELGRIAASAGVSLPELALRWLVGHEGVGGILLGASAEEHLLANLAALARGPLPVDVTAACDQVGRVLSGPMPPYHR